MDIYKYNISDYTERQLDEMRPFCQKSGKALPQSIVAHYCLKQILAQRYATPPERILFCYNEHGKPYFRDDCKFSITHTSDRVWIAVSDSEVGIDAERVRPVDPKAFPYALTAQEAEALRHSKQADIDFLKIWTVKEAYFKATGTGIVAPATISAEQIQTTFAVTTQQIDDYILSTVVIESSAEKSVRQ